MPRFLVGDGEKFVDCGDGVVCDGATGDTLTFTHPGWSDLPLRLTVIDVAGEEYPQPDYLREETRQRASEAGCAPIETPTTTFFIEPPRSSLTAGFVVQFAFGATSRNLLIVSLSLAEGELHGVKHQAALVELRRLIETFRAREAGEACHAELSERDRLQIEQAVASLMEFADDGGGDAALLAGLENVVGELVSRRLSRDFTPRVGLAFGHYLVGAIPGLAWRTLVDDDGRVLCLRYLETSITLFPTAMVEKRIRRSEAFSVEDLVEGTIDAIEDLLRKNA